MYIDTHCHLSKEDYDDIDLVVKEDTDALVNKIIISGCSYDSIIESIEISKKYDNVFLTLGYHPSEAKVVDDNKINYALRDIKLDNPTYEELTAWHKKSGLPTRKFFNTSGLLYKSLDLKNKLPDFYIFFLYFRIEGNKKRLVSKSC